MVDYHIKRLGHRGDGVAEEGYFAPLTLPQERISAEAEGKSLSNVEILEPLNIVSNRPAPILNPAGDVPCNMPQTVLSQTGRSMWCAKLWRPMG